MDICFIFFYTVVKFASESATILITINGPYAVVSVPAATRTHLAPII